VHGGADALEAGALAGSVHGARSYWRIMRAAAAAAKFRNRARAAAAAQTLLPMKKAYHLDRI